MKSYILATVASGLSLSAGPLTIGPDYKRPETDAPARFKAEDAGQWKVGAPSDHISKGAWWEIFGDAKLNELERAALLANQELKAAFATVNQARATARIARPSTVCSKNQ